MVKKEILAIGGGVIPEKLEESSIYAYILKLVKAKVGRNRQPKMLYLGTAYGDDSQVVNRFLSTQFAKSFDTTHLSFFDPPDNWQKLIFSQDIIFVSGGNTKSMLAIWQEWEVDDILKKVYENGIFLAGISAGAICWFDVGVSDSIPNQFSDLKGLGLISGSCCPHFNNKEREVYFQNRIENRRIPNGCGIPDDTLFHYIDGVLSNVITSKN